MSASLPGLPRNPARFWQAWDAAPEEHRDPFRQRLLTWPEPLWDALDNGPTRSLGLSIIASSKAWREFVKRNQSHYWERLRRHDPDLFQAWTSPGFLWPEALGHIVKLRADRHLAWLIEEGVVRPHDPQDDLASQLAWRSAIQGWIPGLDVLRAGGLTREARHRKGRSLAHAAVYGQHMAVMDWLIEWGMDVTLKDDEGRDPLYTWAAFCESEGRDRQPADKVLPWVMGLVERGFDPYAPTGKTSRSRSFVEWTRDQSGDTERFWGVLTQALTSQKDRQALMDAIQSVTSSRTRARI